jgi:hypothetical protein
VQRTDAWHGRRFWYAFNPQRQGQLLEIGADQSLAYQEHPHRSGEPEPEIWVRLYVRGVLVREDHKVGNSADMAMVVGSY